MRKVRRLWRIHRPDYARDRRTQKKVDSVPRGWAFSAMGHPATRCLQHLQSMLLDQRLPRDLRMPRRVSHNAPVPVEQTKHTKKTKEVSATIGTGAHVRPARRD